MKVIQIVPRVGLALYTALVKKGADIRKKGLGTFYRAAAINETHPSGAIEPIAVG